MERAQEIERVLQRTRRYWYEDGLTEIAVGCVFALIGLLFAAEAVLPGPFAGTFSSLGLVAIVMGGSWLGRRAVGAAKARLTYPRTGYVAYRRTPGARSRQATGILGATMGMLVAFLMTTAPVSLAWVPALEGLLVGAAFLYATQTLGLVRFAVLAVVSALGGAAVSLGGYGDVPGSALYFGGLGLALLASGGLTLALYMARTRPAEE